MQYKHRFQGLSERNIPTFREIYLFSDLPKLLQGTVKYDTDLGILQVHPLTGETGF